MPLLGLILISLICLLAGYVIYGGLLSRWLNVHNNRVMPAHQFRNDNDFIPTNEYYLLSQHLSAIAAAGPIVGPILAGMWFGWLPTFVWIVLGGILIGGVHDFVSILASTRNEGRSIAQVIRLTVGHKAFIVFLVFLWLSLLYIIAAFTDVTTATFIEPTRGAAIASSSMMYLLLALIMGVVMRKLNPPLWLSTVIFMPMVFFCIYLGPIFPLQLQPLFGFDLRMTWNILLLFYCFLASILPVWLLLQPRGYLGGFFLALITVVSLIGVVIGSFSSQMNIQFPAFVSWSNPQGFPLLPMLFTTVACGACSGFHCLIASGTTSKQLAKETDAKVVGYGGMLIESFVAVIALGTLLILTVPQAQTLKDPNQIYASGVATFLAQLGINKEFALNFALLAFATFVYDTLDVATRLGRYIFEELTGWRKKWSPYVASVMTLILPFIFLNQQFTDAAGNPVAGWKIFWTAFGSSNQLLAAIVLVGLSLWLMKSKLPFVMAILPAIFMTIIAVMSLGILLRPWLTDIFINHHYYVDTIGLTALVLLLLTGFLLFESAGAFFKKMPSK